jgi:ubiquinone/menaquinone biosynthesis C-methylase UbiE
VLEVGGGSGRDSIRIKTLGGDVYVLDYAESSLKTIKEQIVEEDINLKLIKGDAFKLPFKDNSFDIVFHQGLIEHFLNPEIILRENVRVLKSGGLILVDAPQRYHLYTLLKHILIFFNKWFAGWETEYSIKELENMLKNEGVKKIISVYGDWMNPSILYRILREIFFKFGIKLPLYPKGIWFNWWCRE